MHGLPRLKKVREIAQARHRFLHWELEFADLFEERGGFDLILGNPPWIKIEWDEGGVMGDVEPLLCLCASSPRHDCGNCASRHDAQISRAKGCVP